MFKFSLQSVLDHRMDTEEDCKNKYQKARQFYQEQCDKVEEIRFKISEINERFKVSGKVLITELQQLSAYQEQLRHELTLQEQEKNQAEKKVVIAQKELLKATMDVQIIEKLKEKQHDEFLHQERFEENRMLDELACINYERV